MSKTRRLKVNHKAVKNARWSVVDKGKGQEKLVGYQYGSYFWMLLDEKKLLRDDDGNPLNIPARKDDLRAISEITSAARYYGYPNGKAVFVAGVGRVSEEEYSEQIDRFGKGELLLNDLGSVYDAQQTIKHLGE
jgi:hypothetical protein